MRYLIWFLAACFLFTASASASSKRYITADIVVYDERFYQFINAQSQLEILATELGWAEGPVWVESLHSLLFSDVAADTVYRWDETRGLSSYLYPSGHDPATPAQPWRGSNGLAVDTSGHLYLAQQSNRVVSRMLAPLHSPEAHYESLASKFEDQSINSPNDLVVHDSGDIYFTDPPYGLAGFEKSPDIELDFFGVFRLTRDGELFPVIKDIDMPNGIALSTSQSTLYVSNSAPDKARIMAIELDHQGNLKDSRLFFDARNLISDGPGSTDGMTMHPSDFLFVSLPNGLGILSPEGELLGKLSFGQVTNMALDNVASHLYITTPSRLLRLKINPVE